MKFPKINIRCDEQDQTQAGYRQCTRGATHMLTLAHVDGHCDPQTIALCQQHLGGPVLDLKLLQKHLTQGIIIRCNTCQKIITRPQQIGNLTQI